MTLPAEIARRTCQDGICQIARTEAAPEAITETLDCAIIWARWPFGDADLSAAGQIDLRNRQTTSAS